MKQETHDINKEIEVLAIPTDISDTKSVAALWEKIKAKFGHADVLINNAGTQHAGLLATISEDS